MTALVLIVEDETILGKTISTYLTRNGFQVELAQTGEAAIRLAEEAHPEVAVVDIRLPRMNGLEVLDRLAGVSPSTAVIMMTAHASVPSAVDAMRRGAFDYLPKPFDLEELRVCVDKALETLRLRRELSYLKSRDETSSRLSQILGNSEPIRDLRRQIGRIAALESPEGEAPPVLIVGETGSGKEMVARAIHYSSRRARGPFVEINCAAIPASLLEAELFGYEKGAYTDARDAKPGLFEAADGGTLFLDEIGQMDLAMQAKLLKAIEEKSIRRVGGLRAKGYNARIISATNRDLTAALAEGAIRPDFYYRIKGLIISVPPLRARGDDIALLAQHFLERFARQYGLEPKALTPEAEVKLRDYSWPGNVRELAHVIEHALFLHPGRTIQPGHLTLPDVKSPRAEAGSPFHVDFASGGIVLDEVERHLIAQALDATGWNRAQAAQLLGISKETLRYRIERHQLHPSQGQG